MSPSRLSINPPTAWSIKSHCLCLGGKAWALCIAFWQAPFPCSVELSAAGFQTLRSWGPTGSVSCYRLMSLKACNDSTAIWWIWFDNSILPFVWHLIAYKARIHYLVCTSQQLFMGSSAYHFQFNNEGGLWSLPGVIEVVMAILLLKHISSDY